MEEFLKKYYKLIDLEKATLKSILKEILEVEIKQEKNKWKEFINQEEINKWLEEWATIWLEVIIKNWVITEKELEELNKLTTEGLKKQILKIYWINNTEKILFFPVYIWNDLMSGENYSLFCNRLNNLKFLEKNNIIKTLNYNEVEKLYKYKIITNKIDEIKQNLYNKHPKFIIDRQLEVWEKIKYNFLKVIIFEKEKIENLIELLNEIDIWEFKYENHNLFYWWKVIYTPKLNSDRDVFLNLFFTKEKKVFISLKQIFDELEWWNWAIFTENQWKRIYRIRTDLNKRIKELTWIEKDFFTLQNIDYEGKIKRNY